MDSIFRSKIVVPRPGHASISRSRFLEKLAEGHRDLPRVTVVAAPPGSGKTTATAQWAASCGSSLVWLTLDPTDNEPLRLLRHLHAGLIASLPALSSWLPVGLQLPDPASLALSLAVFFEDAERETILVLDDYHQIRNPYIHDVFNVLLRNLPSQLHLILVSREDPPLKLARIRAEGRLTEIRSDTLAFTAEEIDQLAEARGIHGIPQGLGSMVHRHTEGWAVAVSLGIEVVGEDGAEAELEFAVQSRRHLVDYLVQEVLDSLDEETTRFLLDISVLERLDPAICKAITGNEDCLDRLAGLARRHLFTSLMREEPPLYRLHPLFGEFLRNRLHPDRKAGLYAGAARAAQVPGESLAYARLSGDPVEVRHALHAMLPKMLASGALGTYRQWLYEERATVEEDAELLSLLRMLDLIVLGASAGPTPPEDVSFFRRWENVGRGRIEIGSMPSPSPSASNPLSTILWSLLVSAESYLEGSLDLSSAMAEDALQGSREAQAPLLTVACLVWFVHVLLSARGVEAAGETIELEVSRLPGAASMYLPIVEVARADIQLCSKSLPSSGLLDGISSAREALTALGLHYVLPLRPASWLREGALSLGDVKLADSFLPFLPKVAAARRVGPDASPAAGSPDITRRELEVVRLMAKGLRNAEIAAQLFVSPGTVKWHVVNILQKLNAGSRTQAVARARELGIVP